MTLRIAVLSLAVTLAGIACNSSPTVVDSVVRQEPAAGAPAVIAPNGEKIRVEIAANDVTRAQGLMFRASLPPGTGMLFLFPSDEAQGFWMKNTLIPLDMIWIDSTMKVVDVKTAVPCRADPCPTYDPNGPARFVLEIAAGEAAKYGLAPGATVRMENLSGYTAR